MMDKSIAVSYTHLDSALTSEAVQKNYINQLVTTDEKQTEKSINQVLDGEGVNIDFNATTVSYTHLLLLLPSLRL